MVRKFFNHPIGQQEDYNKHQFIPYQVKLCLVLTVFIVLTLSSCQDSVRIVGRLFIDKIPTPTPYLTPLPSQNYVYDSYVCGSSEGGTYLFDAELAYFPFKSKLRNQVSEAERRDIPPILDEIRVVHSELVKLEPPVDCPILVELDHAMEAEVSTTISAFTAFYNGEEDEIWMGMLKTMLEYNKQVNALLDQIYFRD